MGTLGELRPLVAVALVALAGCDAVFGLEREPPPELAGYDRCGAFLYDDPLRYAMVQSTNVVTDELGNTTLQPWSWDDARTACQLRGMDLAVFNDMHELGRGIEDPIWPYWIGQRSIGGTEETVDGCPALEAPVAQRFVAHDTMACGMVAAPTEIDGASCDGTLPATMEPNVVTSALCETPRPDSFECLGQDPTRTMYLRSDAPMSFAAAKKYCADRDAHMVVVETGAEWLFLSEQARETWSHPFWIGAQLEGTQWRSVTSCYGVYSWTGGTPGTPASGSCVAAQLRVAEPTDETVSGAVLEGVAPTACSDAQTFALCEID